MASSPSEVTLEIIPNARVDVIDVTNRIQEASGDGFFQYPRAIYCSHHTTAGFFEQSLCARLKHNPDAVQAFVRSFQKLFPPDADYRHDQMDLRTELSEEQKICEPRNADSHLTYISSGLENCVTYVNHAQTPVYFVELDGINKADGNNKRRRRTTVVGYNRANVVKKIQMAIPVSTHAIDSINMRNDRLGIFEELNHYLNAFDIQKGRIDISLSANEHHTGLTVNEYETLLMTNDLVDVLQNPIRFMAEKGKNMLRDPKAIPNKAKNYAKYDLVQIVNEFIDVMGLNESMLERIIDRFMAVPARRFLRMKRSLSLMVSDHEMDTSGQIVQGTYQSPILVQWKKSPTQSRIVDVTFVRFE